ncbi:hypothetical protein D052_1751, partial [Vibrio parahaemolyticus 10290]
MKQALISARIRSFGDVNGCDSALIVFKVKLQPQRGQWLRF